MYVVGLVLDLQKLIGIPFTIAVPIRYHAHGILAFMNSGLIDTGDPNLVTVSHCGASGVL